PQLPQTTQTTVTPVSPVPSPQPQAKAEKELSKAEKLKLLEERLLKGEIDLATYKELRNKFETESKVWIPQPQPRLPP
ncbi:MAG: hypothetical protein KAJ51_07355, partial [Thermoplasmata archaeon]|nr:hypothetical protein [Thermoplasmata archaeon]